MFPDEKELKEALALIYEIDNDPKHPVNVASHPIHEKSLEVYEQLVELVNSRKNKYQMIESVDDIFI